MLKYISTILKIGDGMLKYIPTIRKIGKGNIDFFNLLGALALLFWVLDWNGAMVLAFRIMIASFFFGVSIAISVAIAAVVERRRLRAP